MNIIAYDNSKITVLFPFEEVSPLSGESTASIVSRVISRFSFQNGPDLSLPKAELDKGLKFERGVDVGGSGSSIAGLDVYSDGVVINAQTTDIAERFWENLSLWMIQDVGFRQFRETPARRFISQIVVEFDKPVGNIIKMFETFSGIVSKKLENIYQADIPLGFSRLDLEFDKQKSSLIVPKFIIERRLGIAFAKERYHCSAPMRTNDHIEVLNQIEDELL